MHQFSVDLVIRGFHIFRKIWKPDLEQTLIAEMETEGTALLDDRFAIACRLHITATPRKAAHYLTVGHLPRFVSQCTYYFIRNGGEVCCYITDVEERLSLDLPKRGLEIPCKVVFRCNSKKGMERMEALITAEIQKYRKVLDEEQKRQETKRKFAEEKRLAKRSRHSF